MVKVDVLAVLFFYILGAKLISGVFEFVISVALPFKGIYSTLLVKNLLAAVGYVMSI